MIPFLLAAFPERIVPREVFLDYQSTTPVDPQVLEVMLPALTQEFGNPGSVSHQLGRRAAEMVDEAAESLAKNLNCSSRELVFTSGATESNNLAMFGAVNSAEQKQRSRAGEASAPRRKIVSVKTEHRAILDPLKTLEKRGYEIVLLDVLPHGKSNAGQIELSQFAAAADEHTLLATVMLANNEIGVVQPLQECAQICQQHGVLLHTDATQAVGKLPVDVQTLGCDLLSFSAHKMYGPKGVGGLYVKRRTRLQPQIEGGGQQRGLRSGTLNVPGIVGMAKALEICVQTLPAETVRTRELRNLLWKLLQEQIPNVQLNGPALDLESLRLPGNLNCQFPGVEGEALMLRTPELAVSSGSACTSAEPKPSHVLLALGLTEDEARSSLRMCVGRYTTEADVRFAAEKIATAVEDLRKLG